MCRFAFPKQSQRPDADVTSPRTTPGMNAAGTPERMPGMDAAARTEKTASSVSETLRTDMGAGRGDEHKHVNENSNARELCSLSLVLFVASPYCSPCAVTGVGRVESAEGEALPPSVKLSCISRVLARGDTGDHAFTEDTQRRPMRGNTPCAVHVPVFGLARARQLRVQPPRWCTRVPARMRHTTCRWLRAHWRDDHNWACLGPCVCAVRRSTSADGKHRQGSHVRRRVWLVELLLAVEEGELLGGLRQLGAGEQRWHP